MAIAVNYKEKIVEEINQLPQKRLEEVIDFIKFLREKETHDKINREEKIQDNVIFGTHHLGKIMGKLTREEIYDYL